jgi:hypothetical protein
VVHREHGRIVGAHDGIPLFLPTLGKDGLSLQLIPRGVRDMDKLLQMAFKEIGELRHVNSQTLMGLMIDYDLEAGFDYISERYGFIDADRAVALGASYGGYMVLIISD